MRIDDLREKMQTAMNSMGLIKFSKKANSPKARKDISLVEMYGRVGNAMILILNAIMKMMTTSERKTGTPENLKRLTLEELVFEPKPDKSTEQNKKLLQGPKTTDDMGIGNKLWKKEKKKMIIVIRTSAEEDISTKEPSEGRKIAKADNLMILLLTASLGAV